MVPELSQASPAEDILTQELFKLLQRKNTEEDILSIDSLDERVGEQPYVGTEAKTIVYTDNLEDMKPAVKHSDVETRSKAVFVKCKVCLKKVRKDMLEKHKKVKHSGKTVSEKITIDATNINKPEQVREKRIKIGHNIKKEVLEEAETSDVPCKPKTTEDSTQQMNNTSENVPFCSICDIKFKDRKYLLKHNTAFHKYRKQGIKAEQFEFVCPKCNETFLSEKFMKRHLSRKHNSITACMLCKKTFKKAEYLKTHQLKVHGKGSQLFDGAKTLPCQHCKEPFTSDDLLDQHIKTKHKNLCQLCKQAFKKSKYLYVHQDKFHKDELHLLKNRVKETYKCQLCFESFMTANILEFHKGRKHNKVILNHESRDKNMPEINKNINNKFCTLCKKQFSRKHILDTHKSTIHKDELNLFTQERYDGDEKYVCKKCNGTFLSEKVLNHHVRNHHIFSKDPIKCSKCDVVFEWSAQRALEIKNHNQRFHKSNTEKNEETFCKLCSRNFKYASNFEAHKVKVHNEEMQLFDIEPQSHDIQYICSFCKKSFISENSLSYHIKYKHEVKEKRKALNCEICKKEFKWSPSQREKLKGHMKKAHSVQVGKLYKCKLCYLEFNYKDNIKIHQENLHKEDLHFLDVDFKKIDLKHNCSQCSHSFVSENILNYHILRKHSAKAEKVQLNTVQKKKGQARGKPNPVDDLKPSLKCDHCSLVLSNKNKSNMKRHVARMHPAIEMDI